MRANDDPSTRIKAADARALYAAATQVEVAAKLLKDLNRLRIEREFSCLGVIHLHGGCFTVDASADSLSGIDFVIDYLTHIARAGDGVRRERSGVILMGIHTDGMAEVATYGVSMTDCRALGSWGREIITGLTAVPFQTWFGWSTGGKPTPLTPAQIETLSPNAQAWVAERTR